MEKFKECIRQLDEVTMIRDKIRLKHDELKKRRLNEFLSGFSVIATNLKEMYQMITLGGDADLELVDTMDPFSEGINFRQIIFIFLNSIFESFESLRF